MNPAQVPFFGQGSAQSLLSESDVRAVLQSTFSSLDLTGQRVLVIIPDSTRTMPMPLFFRLITEFIAPTAKKVDYLIALGTHPIMSEDAILKLVGITREEHQSHYAQVGFFNHRWDLPETFTQLGTITAEETLAISRGLLSLEVPVRVNRMVLDYDLIIVCGPVFPHEVVGISGGNKYFFPGIAGAEVINFTHWLGALITSYEIIGTKHTPVREVINRAVNFIPTPRLFICPVVKSDGIAGVYVGDPERAWSAAADLTAQIHIKYIDHPYRTVLSVLPEMYDDIWTGAKGMYKLEPVIEDGGEVIIYAPHITEISYTHGKYLDQIGYHVRDYFVKQWDRFKDIPWGVLAHSTHLRGQGTYHNGIESPRIQVTLATGIPRERCQRLNLGYRDPSTIIPLEWANREDEGVLLVPHAGEVLYRLKSLEFKRYNNLLIERNF